jgi:hypothetical protein
MDGVVIDFYNIDRSKLWLFIQTSIKCLGNNQMNSDNFQPIDSFTSDPNGQLTEAQRWVLGVSGMLTVLNSGDPEYFGGGIPIKHSIWAQEKLRNESINTLNDLYRNFNQTLNHIPKPLEMSKGLTDEGDVLIAFKANVLYPPEENESIWWQDRYSLGWKLMRTTYLAGLAQVACMISRQEAWDIAHLTAQIFQFIFDSWDDVYIAAKRSMSFGDPAAEACQNQLMTTNGLWTLPWKQNLQDVTCPADQRRTFYVSANREQNQYQQQKHLSFEEAISQAEDGDRLELAAGVYTGPWRINKSLEILAQGRVLLQAPDSSAASLIIADAFVRLYNMQIVSPTGETRAQVAIACMSGTLLLEQSTVASTGHGISVAKPARAILFRCLVDSCKLNGVVVEGHLHVSQSTFSNIQYHSIHLNHQAYAELSYCLLKDSGSHFLSVENGSIAKVNDSDFENSAQAAIVVTQDSSLDLIRGKMIKAGLIALNAKRCMILDTEFNAAPTYYEAQQQIAVFSLVKEIILVNCSFHKAHHHAVHIDQADYVRIENSSFQAINACGLILSVAPQPLNDQ